MNHTHAFKPTSIQAGCRLGHPAARREGLANRALDQHELQVQSFLLCAADPIEDWPSLSQLMRDPYALLLNTSYIAPQGNLYLILTLDCLLILTLHWFLTLTLRCLLTLLTLLGSEPTVSKNPDHFSGQGPGNLRE